jgi:hypothetical protein
MFWHLCPVLEAVALHCVEAQFELVVLVELDFFSQLNNTVIRIR